MSLLHSNRIRFFTAFCFRVSACFAAALAILIVPGFPRLAAEDAAVKVDENKIPAFILDAYVKLDPEVEKAVYEAQKDLAKRQRSNGSWPSNWGGENAGVTAFAVLALMINGSVPGEGEFSRNIALGVQNLLSKQRSNGVIVGGGNTMYEHAMATLALSEVYGMTGNPRVRGALIKAVNLIVQSQHEKGGWRYNPRPEEGDISVTVMQVMALRSAADAGIFVPEQTFQRALFFIKSCYNKTEKGFTYMANSSGKGFARTAAGVVSLQSIGYADDPIIAQTVKYLSQSGFSNHESYWGYGHYYASVALYHYGGEEWQAYYPRIKKDILKKWINRRNIDALDLSWEIMVLGVPFRYLPIYQR